MSDNFDMEDDEKDSYTFLYRGSDGSRNFSASLEFDYAETHTEVVRQFLNFLSAVYGYDLTENYLGKE